MKKIKFDITDLKILSYLQENGKMTNLALSQAVGISAPPCLRRVRALENSGVIIGYSANLSREKLGYHFEAMVFVSLEKQSEKDLESFKQYIHKFKPVQECYMTSGQDDFILKCIAKDWDGFQKFITKNLVSAPNVKTVKTSPIIQECKKQKIIL